MVAANTFLSFENLVGGPGNDTYAFQLGGSISGTIKDSSGGVVPGATLTLSNTALGTQFKVIAGYTTNDYTLALERELQQQLFQSDDAKEGLDAYANKRKAVFKGK